MADDRPLVESAASPEQVRRADRKVRDQARVEQDDLRAVLAAPQGRRVLWRLLQHCRVFESIFDEGPRIYALAGRQDVGHWLMAEIERADAEAMFRLMVEARKEATKASEANAAARAQEKRGD